MLAATNMTASYPEVKHQIEALKKNISVVMSPISISITTDGARRAISRRWSNAEQLAALNEVKGWWPKTRWVCKEGDPAIKNKKGWKLISVVSSRPFLASIEERQWHRPGAPDSSGDRVNYEIVGEIEPASSFILLLQIAHGRIFKLPGETYNMSPWAQLLYRQGRYFIRHGSGWLLKYDTACAIVGVDPAAGGNRHIARQAAKIEAALEELMRVVHWRQDKAAETKQMKGRKPRGRECLWVLREKAEKELTGSQRQSQRIYGNGRVHPE